MKQLAMVWKGTLFGKIPVFFSSLKGERVAAPGGHRGLTTELLQAEPAALNIDDEGTPTQRNVPH